MASVLKELLKDNDEMDALWSLGISDGPVFWLFPLGGGANAHCAQSLSVSRFVWRKPVGCCLLSTAAEAATGGGGRGEDVLLLLEEEEEEEEEEDGRADGMGGMTPLG
ncbi:hypothetical protein GPALN_012531 [Globodera pallida]|nr:hypothetical protein GPALN_012531 [Globodera pallida]